MSIEKALVKLQDVVKCHRKALVDVEPTDAGSQAVLAAVDTLLEIQELRLEQSIRRLLDARAAAADNELLRSFEPNGRRRYRKH